MSHRRGAAFIGGVLGANSVPHLITAARRDQMLTPFGGTDSGPVANLAWGSANLLAAPGLIAWASRAERGGRGVLVPVATGCAGFLAWALVYERLIAVSEN